MASQRVVLKRPHFQYETRLLSQGIAVIAGLDEVGRGTLAGPVVAGVAVLPPSLAESLADSGAGARNKAAGKASRGGTDWVSLINDSKQLSPAQREEAYAALCENCTAYGTGACDAADIDRIGIVAATRLAMARALEMIDPRPGHLLIDALDLPAVNIPQTSIIKGDATSLSIAAASIIAKVTRDRLMATVLEAQHPGYGFAGHKGYGSAEHIAALYRLGPSPIHRLSFAPVRDALEARRTGRSKPPERAAHDHAAAQGESVAEPAP